ncbi:MAG: UDP-N-acetylmuramoyl-L-alanyl-D-glutamate--2,6-diaminopimelate ligase [candidate division WOR-3 bacterium]
MLKLAQLCRNLPCQIFGDKNIHINGIATHSAKVKNNFLFVALDGYCTSGKQYIDDAIKNGSIAIALNDGNLIHKKLDEYHSKITFIKVNDPQNFLAQICNRFYNFPSKKLTLIGITGTNGKTTTSYLIKSIIENTHQRVGLIGTIKYYDGHRWLPSPNTTPDALYFNEFLSKLVKKKIRYCVSEVSSHGLALNRVAGLNFKIAIFTNLGNDHLDFHKTKQAYGKTKLKLFKNLSAKDYAIINLDDKFSKTIIANTKAKIIGYTLKNIQSVNKNLQDIFWAKINKLTPNYTEVIVQSKKTPSQLIKFPLIGKHNLYNLLAAYACARILKIAHHNIKIGLEKIRPVAGRLQKIANNRQLNIYIDYAHTADALKQVILTIKSITKGKLIVVFGCGGNRDKTKRPKMGRIATTYADYVIITSDNPRNENPETIIDDIIKGVVKQNYQRIVDRRQAIEHAIKIAKPCDSIIIAGKGHEQYQIIGNNYLPFSDRQVVINALKNINQA